ncbi:DNA-directed DNA polymerase POL5 [Aspergillus puulaauensis]|uniref:DNA-directed DNA polymerase n=1 Tax=Aspergillus puulaauensis TaxID=1220207 RepID=A0A7R7XM60_9EURO|nr:DNA-directed DNA polymerase [Aspergillus puulaauensis]BCS23970.1 DNA-directed DNA polymerase [Aspergillus puulaauensis]
MAPHHAGSRKRRREPINVNTKLVEIYEDLASENDEVRLRAAQALVSQFTPDKNPEDEQIQKTLQRLFRGLCSSRKAARIGFSIALTEVLSQVFAAGVERPSAALDVPGVLGIWESVSNAAASESKQEQKDHHFGRLFGAEAIIKSSILFSPRALFPEWKKVLGLVFDLAKKKPWIREECGWIVYRCIHDISSQKADAKLVETALQILCSNDLARTPEGVAIWLAAKDRFPGISFPSKVWKHDDPLDSKERNQLVKAMKESSSADSEGEGEKGAKASGVWNSKLHFAWDAALLSLNSTAKQSSKSKGSASRLSFADFWTEVVDNGLFASASSEERKYWGFLLFIKVINEHSLELASHVFTKNLVRCLTNQLAVEDRYLHRMAVKAAKAIQSRVSKEPEFAAASIDGLMGSAGAVNFDQITKTKTVEKIVAEANLDALNAILPLFEKLVASPGTSDSKAAASNRQVLAGLMLSVVRARVSASDAADAGSEAALERILFTFARFAYFTSEDEKSGAQPPFTQQSQELFRSRINSSLNSIIAAQKHAATLPYAVVRKIRDAAKSEEFGKFIITMDDTLKDSVKGAFKALKKLSSSETSAAGVDAFKLLYSMTILQVYNGDADAASMLEELDFCYNKIFGDKKSKKEEETSEASDALVEILLSFASKPSQLFRRMSEQVFAAFAPNVTATGLESLTSILEAKESLAGQQEMFDQQDDEEDVEGDEDEDEDMIDVDEEDSDVEVVNPEDDNASSASEGEGEGEEGNDEDAAEIAAFEAKLASALGTHRADQDLKEEESESDEDMNDDEMDEVDTQLAKVFKARHDALSKKQDKKDAKETMVNFKNRVLDLLEIYVKKCHSSILALDLILPLLRLTRRSSVKQISNKANSVLREYTKLCKGTSVPALEPDSVEPVWELLKAIHGDAMHSGPPTHGSGCSQASLLVVKVLTAHDKDAVKGIVDVYGETRKSQLLSSKCHVQPTFFTDWNNWCVSASRAMKN